MPVSLKLTKSAATNSRKRLFYRSGDSVRSSQRGDSRSKKALYPKKTKRSTKPLNTQRFTPTPKPAPAYSDEQETNLSLPLHPAADIPDIPRSNPKPAFSLDIDYHPASNSSDHYESEPITPADQPLPSFSPTSSTHTEIEELKELIKATTQKISDLETEKTKIIANPSPRLSDPEEFNGKSSTSEEITLLEAQLHKLEKQNKILQHQLEETKSEFNKEKQHFEKTITELKSELHRSQPLQESKFFTISKELNQAVKAIESLVDPNTEPTPQLTLPPTPAQSDDAPPPQEPKPVVTTQQTPVKSIQVQNEETKKKRPNKSKKLISLVIIFLVIIGLGAIVTYQLTKPATVDQALVDSYIADSGDVKGSQSTEREYVGQGDKNLDIPFELTTWETFKDSFMNVSVSYPAQLVERLQTSSSITFLRKNGFLFRVQAFETTETLEDYWNRTKENGLNYQVEETTFNSKPAYQLTLTDQTDFPGDRILVRHPKMIFDIWYATPSDKFSADDIKRAKHMLESFRWLD